MHGKKGWSAVKKSINKHLKIINKINEKNMKVQWELKSQALVSAC